MYRIIAFGEILWDLFSTGKKLGGAPANFAYHASLLGNNVSLLSKVGNDSLGNEIQSVLAQKGLACDGVLTDVKRPTGTVLVTVTAKGQPAYEIVQETAWDSIDLTIDLTNDLLEKVNQANAFYFGTLALRSETNRATLQRLLCAIPQGVLRVLDLNLRAPFYDKGIIKFLLQEATFLKLNDEELAVIFEMFADDFFLGKQSPLSHPTSEEIQEDTFSPDHYRELIEDRLRCLMNYFSLQYVALTCGANGSFLFDGQGAFSYCPAQATTIVDTVGAGDSFTAVCVTGLLLKRSLSEINTQANRYAAFLCSQGGGMPDVPKELTSCFHVIP